MNDVEELLREGMERFTRDLRVPVELTRQLARRRRRWLAMRSMTGVGAALTAGAVALVAVVLPGTTASVAYAAYVVKRVDSALSAAEPGEIAQMTVTRSAAMPGGKTVTTTAEEWSYGNQWRSVTNSPAGHPVYDEGLSGSSVFTLVSYPTGTWARQRGLGRPSAPVFSPLGLGLPNAPLFGSAGWGLPNGLLFGRLGFRRPKALVPAPRSCRPVIGTLPLLFQPGLPGIGFAASSLPAARAMRNAISCGTMVVAGRQRVNGIEAIELASRPHSPISETIWVTPGTYLPVRVVLRSDPGALGVLRQTADITWLQPTAQNLARLTVPIPAGYRRVRELPLALALLPILHEIRTWPQASARAFGLAPAGPSVHPLP
jgi:hypothetical protein